MEAAEGGGPAQVCVMYGLQAVLTMCLWVWLCVGPWLGRWVRGWAGGSVVGQVGGWAGGGQVDVYCVLPS